MTNKAKASREMEEAKLELYKEAIKCLKMPVPSAPTLPAPAALSCDNDDIRVFLKSVESTLRRFSGRDLTRAKKKINDALYELEMELVHGETATASVPPTNYRMPLNNVSNLNWPTYGSNIHDSCHNMMQNTSFTQL